ncbi:serine/threonine-protein kinase TBK1-like [Mya arenaria]|uniref:serine/threonine-protein kinase TBK1-like n=1 Tax=Mya arenaria TaxID=6604 RepID=UPI0022E69E4E|nr:serine/threonine-protein kinase TBK1-like [Mya arenaria]XP_052781598.1 serine/threonine-protein kinase TBK1-like [Mya arenaria]XP_052781600.1 serine/threonine-protein kinase TBK1-like [Mya arenaria]
MSLRGSGGFLWDVTKPLGQGATSMVYKGRNKSTGEEVAVKVFSQAAHMRPAEVQMREFVVMKKLTHRNIVPLLAIEEEQGTNNKVIVMQLTEHGSLYNMLEEPNNAYGLPEEEFLIVFDHVTAGMKYMRDNGIVHRDIKPGNILRYIGEDGRSIYKLTDFGAAKQVENDEEQFMSLYGTEEYLHPDMYERAVLRAPHRKQFTSKVDLWSLGVSFFHVATGMLPFKPYGGRKNREKMFEITRHKESGMIMGVQHTEGGAIEWSRELPPTCRLSVGVKHLITPIFARLLEADPHKVWNFDELFLNVEGIIRKRVIHVFCSHTWRCLKVYIDSNKNLTNLQELIAEQTDIQHSDQLLIFDGQLLKDCVQPMLPIHSYPDGITANNPIFCYNRDYDDTNTFPQHFIKEFPKFHTTSLSEDYSVSKQCSAIACFIKKEVELYCLKQDLMRRSVHMYINEVYHECGHLVDYNLFLSKNCDTTLKWKENFIQMLSRELRMINLLTDTNDPELHSICLDLTQFYESSRQSTDEESKKITELSYQVQSLLSKLQEDQLNKKQLKKLWNDSTGCNSSDRCTAKVQVVVEQILKIKQQFSENRRKTSLSFNDEQIHKYEKSRLSENCVKIKSLFTDHCLAKSKEQFGNFHAWYSKGCEMRAVSEHIESKLLQLAELLEDFISRLNRMSLRYKSDIERCLNKVESKIQRLDFNAGKPESFPPVMRSENVMSRSRLESKTSVLSAREESKRKRFIKIKELLDGLSLNKDYVAEMRDDLKSQSEALNSLSRQFEKLGQSDSLMSQSVKPF